MSRRRSVSDLSPRRALLLIAVILWPLALPAADLLRPNRTAATAVPDAAASAPSTVTPTAAPALVSAQDRLARTTQTLTAVRQMQQAARDLAKAGPNSLKPNLPAVPVNSYGVANGLVLARGVPQNLSNPTPAEKAALWTGASLPTVATTTTDGTTATEVTIKQNQQQAVLNWETFNIGKNTTLTFDQGLGGANVSQWIAFNVVRDPTAAPTQILGRLRTIGLPDAKGAEQVGGQLYVMNANGIIFGGSSQVNTHALVASSLPINYNLIQRGLLNNPDGQFLFSTLPQVAGSKGPTAAFDPAVAAPDGSIPVQTSYAADGHYGDVEVQAGAQLTAPTNADHVGGRVALVGANVTNTGTISTPNGQAILAAGLQVGLVASSDPGLRGLNVYVGAEAGYSGTVTNGVDSAHPTGTSLSSPNADGSTTVTPAGTAVPGLIDGQRADGAIVDVAVTMVGRTVNQLGMIDGRTSVALNSRVDLLAEYNAIANPRYTPDGDFPVFIRQATATDISTGTVTFGPNSLTRILPDLASTDRVVGAELALPSQINARGLAVHLAADSSGASTILAPSADVSLAAGKWIAQSNSDLFLNTDGQVYFDAGTVVDVSGSRDVAASVTENIVAVELRGPQLADSPLQRDGPLRGQTVYVDLRQTGTYNGKAWVGTPLADASGYIGLVQRTVGELTTAGGNVSIAAGGSVVMNKDATIDVSGGWTNYAGGKMQTTKLVADGHVYDISQATPDRVYNGIFNATTSRTDPKWGVTQSNTNPLAQSVYEDGYQQGANAGSVTLRAPAMVLDGALRGQTFAGARQRVSAGQIAKTLAGSAASTALPAVQLALALPVAASLTLQFDQDYTDAGTVYARSPTAPEITISTSAAKQAVKPVEAFPAADSPDAVADLGERGEEKAKIGLDPALLSADPATGGGFGSLTVINREGDIHLGSDLTLAPGGSLALDGANIFVAPHVTVTAPAGQLSFIAHNFSPYDFAYNEQNNIIDQPVPDPDRGLFSLGAGATLSTAGLVIDDRVGKPGAGTRALQTNGYRADPITGVEQDAVAIQAYRVDLASGSTIDVSGGASVSAAGKVTYGNAGKISILAVLDPQGTTTAPIGQLLDNAADIAKLRGYLHFDPATVHLKGFAGQGGRSGGLTLRTQLIQIEDPLAHAAAADKALDSPANFDPAGTLLLTPDFFNQGGFGSFSLIGLGELARDTSGHIVVAADGSGSRYIPGIYVAPTVRSAAGADLATTIAPHAASLQASFDLTAGSGVTLAPQPVLLPEGARNPVSIKLTAAGVQGTGDATLVRGDLVVGQGATIQVDPQGSVALAGSTVQVDGRIVAPAGTIDIKGAGAFVDPAGAARTDAALPTVVLGSQSSLSAIGAVVGPAELAPNSGILGNVNTGSVLAGGKISVQGNIVAESGSVLDVSGAHGELELLPAYSGGAAATGLVPTVVESDAGSIVLQGTQLLVTNATLKGAAGGASAKGGSLAISSGHFTADPVGQPVLPNDVNIEVTAASRPLAPGGVTPGVAVADADGHEIEGSGHFAAADFWNSATHATTGGFDALTLAGNVQFDGSVELGAGRSLTVATGGFLYSVGDAAGLAQDIVLRAPEVTLGMPFTPPVPTGNGAVAPVSIFKDATNAPYYVNPTTGAGTLAVKAEKLVSLGNLSLQLINAASFSTEQDGHAVAGDIRGNGTLNIAGSLDFTAGQIYPPTETSFTVVAYDYLAAGVIRKGSVNIHPVLDAAGAPLRPAVPLSAGGQLSIYASTITQGGVLRAPLGVINLGWNGQGTPPSQLPGAPVDLLAGPDNAAHTLTPTRTLTLANNSITSVSAVDPLTNQPLVIPYGYSPEGTTWVDPSGVDITTLGPPRKAVIVSALDLIDEKGSSIDLGGGGDLYAYRWIPGVGGSKDILDPGYVPNPASPALASFAILPDFTADLAPYAPFGAGVNSTGYAAAAGLTNGDKVHLDLNNGRGVQEYTLLPARYALLPGAYLVTPTSGVPPAQPIAQADGSRIVAGYRTNSFAPAAAPVLAAFEVALGTSATPATPATPAADAPKSIVRSRAQYADFRGNAFFTASAAAADLPVWRLPADAGYLLLTSAAGGTIELAGSINAKALAGTASKGGVVDIDTPTDILIVSSLDTAATIADKTVLQDLSAPLVLDAATLNSFGAESLLIGGYRTAGTDETDLHVSTQRLALSNAGEALLGTDVILAANLRLELGPSSTIAPAGTFTGADELTIGQLDANKLPVAGSGNGVIVRVSSDPAASVVRRGVDRTTTPALLLDKGAQVGLATGGTGSITLDSTWATTVDPTARINGAAIALGSGQISLLLPGAGALRPQADGFVTRGLVLTSEALHALESSTQSLALLSYSSLDLYGSGDVGNPGFAQIALHTPEIHGDGGSVNFVAKTVSLDNVARAAPADVATTATAAPVAGSELNFKADNFQLGAGQVSVLQYEQLSLDAAKQLVVSGAGGLATQGDLAVTTALVTGETAADQKISAGGALTLGGTPAAFTGTSLGAKLVLEGSEVAVDSPIRLPSGSLTLHATSGDVTVAGTLDTSGAVQKFYDLVKYTDGGNISLIADHGDVTVAADAVVNVSGAKTDPADTAHAGMEYASRAGEVDVGTPAGNFSVAGKLIGQGSDSTQSGGFSLDAGTSPGLKALNKVLVAGGFMRAQSFRVRAGDVVLDDLFRAHDFSLSADAGSITVAATGGVDASGVGGSISLVAGNKVTVESGAILNAHADNFDAAGKGGAVRLEAGAPRFDSTGAYITPAATAAVDLRGTVDLSVGLDHFPAPAAAALRFPEGTRGDSRVTFTANGSYTDATGVKVAFAAGQPLVLAPGATVVLAQAGIAAFSGSGAGGSIAVTLPDGGTVALRPAQNGAAALADSALGRNTGTLHLRAPQLDAGGLPLAADNLGTGGADVAVKPITGQIVDASSVVVEGYKVFTPVGGSIDSVKTAVAASGQNFTSNTTAIVNRLLSGQPGLAGVLHLRPGAEIVNSADPGRPITATVTAGVTATNTTVLLTAGGSFKLGTLAAATGQIFSTNSSGRIIHADGTTTILGVADRNVPLEAGSTVVLDNAGTVTLRITRSGATAGTGQLVLAAGATVGGTNAVSFDAGAGANVTLSAAGSSVLTVQGGHPVLLPAGGRVRFSSAGSITSSTGTVTTFSAAATVTVAAGSTVKLNANGTITNVSGTTAVALSNGSYSTAGSTTINTTVGALTLTDDWDLAANRYAPGGTAPAGEPGMLTFRAAGSLIFNGALSDGFASSAYDAPLLADGSQSTSYRLVAGADLSAVDFSAVQPLSKLGMNAGSVLLGRNGFTASGSGPNAKTSVIIAGRFQVIRTGTGDIDIAAGRDVLLLNQFASIYTAGLATADPTLNGTFDLPVLEQAQQGPGSTTGPLGATQEEPSYPVQYTLSGGNVTVRAQGDIAHKTIDTSNRLVDDSEQQLPGNWLYRRGLIDPDTGTFLQGYVDLDQRRIVPSDPGEVMSTTWWIDFSNFFEGIGALGGGNVSLAAGRDVMNVDAVVPTNARMVARDAGGAVLAPNAANLVELGGGDLTVRAGRDINGGVYYVERGQGALEAGRSVLTNATRAFGRDKTVTETWLPTTLFLGKGDFAVSAFGDLRLGPVANAFLLPSGVSNTAWDKSYFSTFDPDDEVDVRSLTGDIRLSENAPNPMLSAWLTSVLVLNTANASNTRPWLRLNENNVAAFTVLPALAPASLRVTAYSGDLNVAGDLALAPSPTGTIEFAVAGSISGLNPLNNFRQWAYSTIRVLDSSPDALPGITKPLGSVAWSVPNVNLVGSLFAGTNGLLQETESVDNDSLQTKVSRHAAGLLHAEDPDPIRMYATDGDLSGLSLFAGKPARIIAADDISDISLALQNNSAADISLVEAGRDLSAFDPNTPLRRAAQAAQFVRPTDRTSGKSGSIEIGGPGTLEVLAGRNLDLGIDPKNAALGITSIGAARNPNLPFDGAAIAVAAGLGPIYTPAAAQDLRAPGVLSTQLAFAAFVSGFLQPGTATGTRYLPLLGAALGLAQGTAEADIAAEVAPGALTESKALALLGIFNRVLRDAARDRNDPDSPTAGKYTNGFAAIAALFPGSPLPTDEDLQSTTPVTRPASPWVGNLSLSTKQIKTAKGGSVSLLVPGGAITVGQPTDLQKPDQGILTERGGAISIFAADNVTVGTSRIFTLRGGDEVIWSTWGDVAAGSGSKTVFSAPPTRVIVDPQSGDVQNDLAGLATGSGIGVLSTLAGVKPADIDLIAPVGTVDAGDAGIRASGNLNVAARVVLNAANIQVGGVSVGTPPPPAPPNLAPLSAASAANAASSSAAADVAKRSAPAAQAVELPSLISVEVLGYGGGDSGDDDDEKREPKADDAAGK